jgi:heme A synthase
MTSGRMGLSLNERTYRVHRLMRIAGGVALVCVAAAIGAFVTIVMTHRPFDAIHRRAALICAAGILVLLVAAWHLAFGRGRFTLLEREPGADDE